MAKLDTQVCDALSHLFLRNKMVTVEIMCYFFDI
jgi:hypothetical protein